MSYKNARILTAIIAVFILTATNNVLSASKNEGEQEGGPGLLIIAHGAPSSEWNKPVLNLEKQVVNLLGNSNPFAKVKVVLMEFNKPSIADGISEMEKVGCSRIIAVPLLIAPSSHSHWDVPALLGVYGNKDIEKELKGEGAEVVRSKLPITITATLDYGNLIPEIMLDRVRELSDNPEEEALVLLAHGDRSIPSVWDKLMIRTMTYICGKTGISYADYGFVHVGQSYRSKGVSLISEAAENRKKVIVVGAYLSMGVEGMHARYLKSMQNNKYGFSDPLEGVSVAIAKDGLLPDKRVAEWIVSIAKREAVASK